MQIPKIVTETTFFFLHDVFEDSLAKSLDIKVNRSF